ncbi:MAG: Ribonuclease Y [uncultured Solirubrobacteraceae bacterium]|uniref:Ribonuclease Y n=1 Tax=uncultured Solirubrobacteraceae bacterium TaxID=1162706 RepID=A0A6J4SE53_9ACTN|nr:MAG: Ribonuclease Y [uncultured Solirubrobacteraceae bacterium]
MEIVIGAAVVALGLALGLLGAASLMSGRMPATPGRPGARSTPGARVTALVGERRAAASPGAAAAAGPAQSEQAAPAARASDAIDAAPATSPVLEDRAAALAERERLLAEREAELAQAQERTRRELERVSGLNAAQARTLLLRDVEEAARHDKARMLREIDAETKRDAGRRVRNILAVAMQRMASRHVAETTISTVALASDDMKGRIIGREGRNIRALEHLTGVDFIVDDTPNAVVLSAFDGVRREVARMTLEKLLQDGRIHPGRIEETYLQAKAELEDHMIEAGEQAAFEANVPNLDPELIKVLGRLKYRTSYGQSVLDHSVECAHLAAMMANEIGASARTARRAALLHDIGKAVSHEVEGPHALVGAALARRHGEPEAVVHAMEAHHNEVDPQTVEAVLVQAADALSGARPGARGESLENYVKRLRELEHIAERHDGVDKVYAMHAGREIRVMVAPEALDDDGTVLLSHEIAREIEEQLDYPGQIKVTVIRESRATDYAR